jgi:hypothetical protein
LTELATDLNVGHLMLLMQFGNTGKKLAAYNTKLFANRVLPKLRGLFTGGRSRCPAGNAPRSRPFSRPWPPNSGESPCPMEGA